MNEFKDSVDFLRNKYMGVPCNSFEEASRMAVEAAKVVGNSFKVKSYPFRIGTALRELGFVVLVKNFSDENLSGILATNTKNGTKLAASVNKNDSPGHQAFALAHELAHYIFDIKDLTTQRYVANYRTDIEKPEDLSEFRANKFAANLLMPMNEFINIYKKVCEKLTNEDFIAVVMSNYFGVSKTAIERRIGEIGL